MRSVDKVADGGNTKLNPAGMFGLGGGDGGGDGEMPEMGGRDGGEVNVINHRFVSASARRSHLVVADR